MINTIVYNNERRVTATSIANSLDVDIQSIKKLIKKYYSKLESFGLIGFEIQKGKGRPNKEYHLNQDQALFIGTLASNTTRVVEFKQALIEAFGNNQIQKKELTRKDLALMVLEAEEQIEKLEKENIKLATRQLVVEKVKDLKGFDNYVKADMGRNINYYVFKDYLPLVDQRLLEPARRSEAHRLAKKAFHGATGINLPDKIHFATNALKATYLGWLSKS
jgi:phage regulator Rha-like protein